MKAAESKAKLIMVNSQAVHQRGVQIAKVDRVLGDVICEIIRLAELDSRLHTATRHPTGKTSAMMIASGAGTTKFALAERCAPKLGQKQNQRVFQ